MSGTFRLPRLCLLVPLLAGWLTGFPGCAAAERTPAPVKITPVDVPSPDTGPKIEPGPFPVMLGIDVLAADGFAAVKGKTIGLLTHPAGVNREGVSTIQILHRAPDVKLVALFAPEHSLYGDVKAGENFKDDTDPRTGLPVYSLHGDNRKPTAAQLKGLDALVIDLQDIGVRSYTYNVTMRYAMEACFTHGVEVVLLDRPNPLGGLKVDGPHLDAEFMSGVGAFRIPYVHGLTMGELALIAAKAPGVLPIPDDVRAKGRLTVVPLRGWNRAMRWPETGLTFVPTSPMIRDFAAVVGYAMVGLGCEYSGFTHGIGREYPFRGIAFRGKNPEELIRDLEALKIPGLGFRKVSVNGANGRPAQGVYVEVLDWDDWNPTELSFHMMRLACVYNPPNPFAKLPAKETRSFNIHVGSREWHTALVRDGAKVDLPGFLATWRQRTAVYQQQTRKYWLYP
jgi:uncharacterized protein YbbC (DUF1343 family)